MSVLIQSGSPLLVFVWEASPLQRYAHHFFVSGNHQLLFVPSSKMQSDDELFPIAVLMDELKVIVSVIWHIYRIE